MATSIPLDRPLCPIRVVGTTYRELVQEFAAPPIVPHSEFFGVV